MKVEGYLFLFIAVFLAPVDVVYWFTSHDPTGTTAIVPASLRPEVSQSTTPVTSAAPASPDTWPSKARQSVTSPAPAMTSRTSFTPALSAATLVIASGM